MRFLKSPLLSGLLVVGALLGTGGEGSAQNRFTINGRFKIEGGPLDGARVVVYKNGVKDRTRTTDLSRFSMDLDLGQTYILSFEKPGFVTKKLSFDTRVPAGAAGNNFVPFEFSVSLFKQYSDVNVVVFNQPVGKIKYDPKTADFDYDTDYSKSIQTQLKEAQAEVEKKQEEERKAGAATEKQAAEAEKARAKAEAEEQKRAAEQARLETERKKAEGEAARKAELQKAAEQTRLETERKKTEQEALKAAEAAKVAEARKADEQRKQAAVPTPKPTPAPMPKPRIEPAPAPSPAPVPIPPATTQPARMAAANGGQDQRRPTPVGMGEETPPAVRPATAAPPTIVQVAETEAPVEVDREEELITEQGKVITVIRLIQGNRLTEYRRVAHKFGSVFYFKNGGAISREVYEHEALAGR